VKPERRGKELSIPSAAAPAFAPSVFLEGRRRSHSHGFIARIPGKRINPGLSQSHDEKRLKEQPVVMRIFFTSQLQKGCRVKHGYDNDWSRRKE
jgi:hypothetical protein